MTRQNNLPMTTSSTGSTEEHTVNSNDLLERVKQIVREGNARKITIRNEAGKSLLEIPLTIGVVGVVLIPVWVAIGTIAALAGKYTIVVEKRA
jgi:nitrogen-specific signal transduction histidine kinase